MSMTYARAKRLLDSKQRNKDMFRLENNTHLMRFANMEHIAVQLHSTLIMTFHPNEDVRLANGGWDSHTTLDRINGYMPEAWGGWRVFGWHGVWFFGNGGPVGYFFEDGMVLKADGKTVEGAERVRLAPGCESEVGV